MVSRQGERPPIEAARFTNSCKLQHYRDILSFSRAFVCARYTDRTNIMQIPTWVKPAVYGAGAGAVALAIIGFNWGGWVTGGTAQKMADSASITAVTTAMTPYCVEQSKNDPRSVEVLAELKAAQGYNRRGVVEKAGWATLLGAEKPNTDLARACETALAAS